MQQGYLYQVEQSSDLISWTDIGFSIYGQSDSDPADEATYTALRVFTTPMPPAGGGAPVAPPAEPTLVFFLTRDGANTLVTWNSVDPAGDSGFVSAYIAADDWRFQSIANADATMLTQSIRIVPTTGDPYVLMLWPQDGQSIPNPAPLATDLVAEDQAHLGLLTSAKSQVESALQNPPPPSAPSVANAAGSREYFRLSEIAADSDGDGIIDRHELTLGSNPANADTNGNGIEDPWEGFTDLIVSEFQAANGGTLLDFDGNDSDWIEILNPTTATISLDNYYLSDKPNNLGKWRFPSGRTIAPGALLVVFASGGNTVKANGEIHTSFGLNANAEAAIISRLAPDPLNPANEIPTQIDAHNWTVEQQEGRSAGWGIDNFVDLADGRTRKLRYFGQPTPGLLNQENAFIGVCSPPVFSPAPGLYVGSSPGPITLTENNNVSGAAIRITTNFSFPGEDSSVYTTPFADGGTQIIRACVTAPGCFPSVTLSGSFLCTDDVLGTAAENTPPADQQVRPPGYPIPTSSPGFPLYYSMDPQVIAAVGKSTLEAELGALPILSLALPVDGFFDVSAGGIYANANVSDTLADPLDLDWRRRASIEYIDATNNVYTHEITDVNIAGNSSSNPSVTRKHNLRLRFRKSFTNDPEGVFRFGLQGPFPNSPLVDFRDMMLRNTTQDSWATTAARRLESTYCKEAWARETHSVMGHRVAHRRRAHLFIDGLYWGVYEMSERINEDFIQSYVSPNASFDVVASGQNGPVAEDGDLAAWNTLFTRIDAAAAAPGDDAKWNAVTALLDLNNYIDYAMLTTYIHVGDWSTNWRALRRNDLDNPPFYNPAEKFQFLVWDAELSMGDTSLNSYLFDNSFGSGAGAIHFRLRNHPLYQQAWQSRVAIHLDSAGGALNPTVAAARFQTFADTIDPVVGLESARWGNAGFNTFSTLGSPHLSTSIPARKTWLTNRHALYRAKLVSLGFATP